MCANIIFDADDTLWKTEELYDQVRNEFAQMLVDEGLGPAEVVVALAKKIDLENFAKLGLSPDRFPQSLVDTYLQRCKDLHEKAKEKFENEIRSKGEEVFQSEAKGYDDVAKTLTQLQLRSTNYTCGRRVIRLFRKSGWSKVNWETFLGIGSGLPLRAKLKMCISVCMIGGWIKPTPGSLATALAQTSSQLSKPD